MIDHDYQKLTDSEHGYGRFFCLMIAITIILNVGIAVMWWMI